MLNRTLRVEAATDERSAEREWLRGIKRNDSIIWSARPNGAVSEHGRQCVQSHRSPVRTRWRDVCRQRAPWQTGIRFNVVAGFCVRFQSVDEIVPRYSVNGRGTCCENVWRKRGGAGCRSTIRVAEKNLDCDRIAKQRLVDPNGPENHCLNGRGDRAVECWMNY